MRGGVAQPVAFPTRLCIVDSQAEYTQHNVMSSANQCVLQPLCVRARLCACVGPRGCSVAVLHFQQRSAGSQRKTQRGQTLFVGTKQKMTRSKQNKRVRARVCVGSWAHVASAFGGAEREREREREKSGYVDVH